MGEKANCEVEHEHEHVIIPKSLSIEEDVGNVSEEDQESI